MDDAIEIGKQDFLEDDKVLSPTELEKKIKKEIEAIIAKYNLDEYIFSATTKKGRGCIMSAAGDGFLMTHVNICLKVLDSSVDQRSDKTSSTLQ